MKLQKRTYALPPRTLKRFEEIVTSGKRSSVVAELIDTWVEEREREALRQEIIRGCQDMADIYTEIEREFHPADEALHRATVPDEEL
jgi:hypothetical protein